jgi:tRNA (mo5U34)-methyltransferase
VTLADEIRDVFWYHTLELPGGIVTPGRWDTRKAVGKVPFPASLDGKRCLDVGTWDGFWAFEMERRGAEEVVAIDLDDVDQWDWPANAPPRLVQHFREGKNENAAFYVAHRALDSQVERLGLSVYDLSEEAVGRFDFVFIGTLLLHLRDPVRALTAIRSVLSGQLLVADQISLTLSALQPVRPTAHLDGDGHPHWWTPNMAGLKRIVRAAGFEIERSGGPYFLPTGPGATKRRLHLRTQVLGRLGLPHAWVLARPSSGSQVR